MNIHVFFESGIESDEMTAVLVGKGNPDDYLSEFIQETNGADLVEKEYALYLSRPKWQSLPPISLEAFTKRNRGPEFIKWLVEKKKAFQRIEVTEHYYDG